MQYNSTTLVHVNGKMRFLGACRESPPLPTDWSLKSPAPNLTRSSLRPLWTLKQRDQGARGTCTDNGTLEAVGWDFVKQGKPDPEYSRLFNYYVTRVLIEGTDPNIDSGASIRDTVVSTRQYGCVPEKMLPYSDDDVSFTVRPSQKCFDEALNHKSLFFYRCPDLNTIKASIADGWPVIMGFNVTDGFMSPQTSVTGIVPMPTPLSRFLGGHCMVYAGWDDKLRQLEGPNSWGSWGDHGWFHMPYGMLEQGYVYDCWTVRSVQM